VTDTIRWCTTKNRDGQVFVLYVPNDLRSSFQEDLEPPLPTYSFCYSTDQIHSLPRFLEFYIANFLKKKKKRVGTKTKLGQFSTLSSPTTLY
jgi:hypothetical protein